MRRPSAFFAALLTSLVLSPGAYAHEEEWFQGGSLHAGTVADWNRASYPNRLATSADWALASKNVEQLVRESGDIETLKPFAEQLLGCIDRISHTDGVINETQTIRVASACMAHMGW